MNFSCRLKLLRNSQMLSVSKLARLSGLSQSFVTRLESGQKQPTLESLYKLSHGLGIGIGELLGVEIKKEPESPTIQRLFNNIQKLSSEQLEALDVFITSISKGYAAGERPLTLQEIQYNPSDCEELEMKLVFSANVSDILEHRIPNGTERNISYFKLYDNYMNQIPIQMIQGNQRIIGRNADKVFIVRPLTSLDDDKVYTLHISRLLQANNYRYLQEDHTIVFSNQEIINITPYNKKLCSPYLTLTLESCNLVSDSEDVPVDTDIRLTFSNDVCSQAVRDHNLGCFALQSSKNQPVEIDIIMAEPHDHPDKKREITIRPRHPLSYNSTYILIISENLTGTNQKLLGNDKIITFTTATTMSNDNTNRKGQSIA